MKIFLTILSLVLSSVVFSQTVSYQLRMPRPQNHYFEVEMMLEDFKERKVDVKLPVWAPGSYLVREFAKNVNMVKAFDGKGRELEVTKKTKNTWTINM